MAVVFSILSIYQRNWLTYFLELQHINFCEFSINEAFVSNVKSYKCQSIRMTSLSAACTVQAHVADVVVMATHNKPLS